MELTEEQIAKLSKSGWNIICQSPLELTFTHPDYQQDGVIGTATGVAAKELLNILLTKQSKKAKKHRPKPKNISWPFANS